MSDPIDTLRNDIARWLDNDAIYSHEQASKSFVAFLEDATPEQRRALLSLLGYEVREGLMWTSTYPDLASEDRPLWVCTNGAHGPGPGWNSPVDALVISDHQQMTEPCDCGVSGVIVEEGERVTCPRCGLDQPGGELGDQRETTDA